MTSSSSYDKRKDHESAIEREIRLAQEREEELRREKDIRMQELSLSGKEQNKTVNSNRSTPITGTNMPIHKVPVSPSSSSAKVNVVSNVTVVTEHPKYTVKTPREMLSPQSYRELTEVDRDSVPKQESIIEKEIREQMKREETLRLQGSLIHNNPNKVSVNVVVS